LSLTTLTIKLLLTSSYAYTKDLKLDIDLKIILLNYQNNYVGGPN